LCVRNFVLPLIGFGSSFFYHLNSK